MRSNFYFFLASISTALCHPLDASQHALPNRYIVSLKAGLSAIDTEGHLSWVRDAHRRRSLLRRDINGVERTFDVGGFHAYAGSFDEDTLAEIESSQMVS